MAYVGEGRNRWSAAHRLDVAPVFRLALEKGEAGARYHAVAEEGAALREIAQAIGEGLGLPVASLPPEQIAEHFGGPGFAVATNFSATSAITQQRLAWRPTQENRLPSDVKRSTSHNA